MVQSAAGLLSLLDEPEPSLQAHALERINLLIDSFWAEVADEVVKIETLSEDANFPAQALASLVASKVYYHLGDLDEALTFALGAGKLFDVAQSSKPSSSEQEYIATVIAKAIDSYVASREAVASSSTAQPADPRLESIVERMFERCERDREYKQAVGIALSSHRLDVLERVFLATKDASLLEWVLQIVVREGVIGGSTRAYKNEVLSLLVKLFKALPSPDYFSVSQCFVYLNDAALASELLTQLLQLTPGDSETAPSDDNVLTAYQIAFDLVETATQEFLESVRNNLQAIDLTIDGAKEHRERVVRILTGEETIKLFLEFLYRNNHADMLILKGTKDTLESRQSIYHSAVTFMNAFANAGTTSDLFLRENLDWLSRASNWSKFSATAALGVIHKGNLAQGRAILEPYLPKADGPTSSFYSEGGSLYALGLVHANHGGAETLDYLKEQLKSTTQNEIIQHGAALGLGVAAMGSGNEEIYEELRTILFNDSAIAGEAAGYAMGLVMLGTGSAKALDEMLQYAHETQHEKIIRGLAIGIAFLMYGKEEEADNLIETLLGDADAVLRYGGIYTIAMAYAGTGNNKAIRELLHVAVSDVNDDVRRAAVTSLGFLLFRNPTQVPRVVQLLSESYNPNVRYGAALALGISCAGTGLEDAIALLEPLTKDPADFVRQGACISLAMILIQQNDSANPKAASTRKIYEKMIGDKHEDSMAKFGAALSQGLIDAGGRNVTISMQNKSGSSNMPAIVGMALFTQFWYWFPLAHMLSLAFTPTAIIGVNKDLQIPKFEFVSNARPSLYDYQPATKPPQKEAVAKVASAVLSTTAKATARAKAKEQAADAMDTDAKKEEKPSATASEDTEMKDENAPAADAATTTAATDDAADVKPAEATTTAKPKRRNEPSSSRLSNLSRVTPAQLPVIQFPSDSRFVPVRPVVSSSSLATSTAATSKFIVGSSLTNNIAGGGGILLVKDTRPNEEAEFLEMEVLKAIDTSNTAATGAAAASTSEGATASAAGPGTGGQDDDLLTGPIADPPPSFEWTDWE
ncbi:proteasome regulatory particle base subunit [Microbotryomycetes sp. JL201]|nr:proteasome regulatory particle base subunit [Microbotryomycetes sp. JL201]